MFYNVRKELFEWTAWLWGWLTQIIMRQYKDNLLSTKHWHTLILHTVLVCGLQHTTPHSTANTWLTRYYLLYQLVFERNVMFLHKPMCLVEQFISFNILHAVLMDLMEYFNAWIVFGNTKLRVTINHSIRKKICKSTEGKKGMFCLLFAIMVSKIQA